MQAGTTSSNRIGSGKAIYQPNSPRFSGVLLGVSLAILLLASNGRSARSEPRYSRQQLDSLIRDGKAWIQAERDRQRPSGKPLSAQQRRLFAPYFSAELLESTRVLEVKQLENPPFMLELGNPPPIDFRQARGLALLDTVILTRAGARADSVLFHELVHLVQYQVLGSDYLDIYVEGWADNDFDYRRIPLEKQAFELSNRFASKSHMKFSVRDDMRRVFGR